MFGKKPECSSCHVTNSNLWKKVNDEIICNSCFLSQAEMDTNTRQSRSQDPSVNTNKYEDLLETSLKDLKNKEWDSQLLNRNLFSKEKERAKRDDCDDDSKRVDIRRRTRKGKAGSKNCVPKGKGRRYIFKKSVSLVINYCLTQLYINIQ